MLSFCIRSSRTLTLVAFSFAAMVAGEDESVTAGMIVRKKDDGGISKSVR